RYAVPVAPTFVLIGLVTLIAAALSLLDPWPMKVLVDQVLGSQPLTGGVAEVTGSLPGAATRAGLLAWVATAGLILFALGMAIDAVLTDAWVRAGQRVTFRLAADVFAKLQRRSTSYHGRTSVGDSMTRVMSDSWCVNTLIDALLFKPVYAIVTGAGVIVIMARMDSRLTLISILIVPLMVVSSVMVGSRIRFASEAEREAGVRISSHVQQSLSGVSVIQSFAQENREIRRFGELADASIRAEQRATVVGQLNGLASGLVTTLGVAAILWLGAGDVLAGRLSLGGLLVFIAYLRTLQEKFSSVAGSYASLQSIDVSVNRVISVLEGVDVPERADARRVANSKGHIRFEAVTFGYEPQRPVLRNVSLEASPGETIAIVGVTGAGKSTLISLIPRFSDPWSGRVLLDNMDVRDLRLTDLRRQIAWVPQETFLFPTTVADNIAFGRPGATRAQIETAAKDADADSFIRRLPNGYDTTLGERGMTLSGGERQRLAIARALLLEGSILIFDEPTSALDAETDELLQTSMKRLSERRTVFVIAHRLSTIKRADRVIVLYQGEIVEEGKHVDLMDRQGAYARLTAWQNGTGEFSPPPLMTTGRR
ncbi:MAG: ABC transporter ATP-binding protein, partial [Nitrospirota bacterium]